MHKLLAPIAGAPGSPPSSLKDNKLNKYIATRVLKYLFHFCFSYILGRFFLDFLLAINGSAERGQNKILLVQLRNELVKAVNDGSMIFQLFRRPINRSIHAVITPLILTI